MGWVVFGELEKYFLKSWSDARAFDGTISIVQPLILPLYAGKSAHEVLDAMLSPSGRGDDDIVRDFWRRSASGIVPEGLTEGRWRRALHDGLIQGSPLPERKVWLRASPTQSPNASRPQ